MDQLIPGPAAPVEAFRDRRLDRLPWPAPRQPKRWGAPRKEGDRLPNPEAMIEDTTTYPAELPTMDFPKGARPRHPRGAEGSRRRRPPGARRPYSPPGPS